MPEAWAMATSSHNWLNFGDVGGSSFSVRLLPSFKCTAAIMMWVTPVFSESSGRIETGVCSPWGPVWCV